MDVSAMSKYSYTEKCGEISGFGSDYEQACRKMVIAGLEWFDKNMEADPKFKGFKNVYGLIIETNEEAKSLTECMNKAINGEATGAMMQACLSHVKYAHQHGWQKYIEMMEKRENNE